jgi:hypothetical protein
VIVISPGVTEAGVNEQLCEAVMSGIEQEMVPSLTVALPVGVPEPVATDTRIVTVI